MLLNGSDSFAVSGLLTLNGALYTTGTTDAYGGIAAGIFRPGLRRAE